MKVQIFIPIFRLVILTIFLHTLFPTKYKILLFLSPVCSLHSNPHLRNIAAYTPPPSLYLISTFSHLGLPQYVCVCAQSCPTLCDPMDCSPPRILSPWDFPGKDTAVGYNFLFQGIFPTQRLNHVSWISCIGRQILYHIEIFISTSCHRLFYGYLFLKSIMYYRMIDIPCKKTVMKRTKENNHPEYYSCTDKQH